MSKIIDNKIAKIILMLLWCVAAVGFIFTPFIGDIKVFMASANQSTYISKNLIVGAYKAWELKSVFSRTLMYFIYKIATVFTDFNTYGFEVACKAVYLIILMVVVWGSVRLIFGKKKENLFYVLVISILLMASHTASHLQVEMTCSLLALLSFGLYLSAIKNEKRKILKLILSGVCIGSMFYFKSALILLSVAIVAAICICNIHAGRKLSIKRMMVVVAGSLLLLFVNLGLIMLINPDEITDMLNASLFQKTLLSIGIHSFKDFKHVVYQFLTKTWSMSWYTPLIIIGAVSFFINFVENIIDKKGRLVFYHIVLWAMPALFVVLSNKYFAYHYFAFTFSSLIEIYFCIKPECLVKDEKSVAEKSTEIERIENSAIENGLGYLKVNYGILGIVTLILVGWYAWKISIISPNTRADIEMDLDTYAMNEETLAAINFDSSEEVLYLDDGHGAYTLGSKSYLKYYFPLPLQRLDEDCELALYTDTKQEALDYTGKYISVYEDWFFGEKNADIKEKIESEYHLAGQYIVFTPPYSFELSDIKMKVYNLYERN